MRKLLLAIIIVGSGLLTSCFSYKDINGMIFITALVVDHVDGEFVLYAEAFHSYRSNKTNTEMGERVVYASNGVTTFDAARKFSQKSSYTIDYTQNKVVIVTQRAAEKGLKNILDLYERYQDALIRSHILILEGDPKALMEIKIKEDEYIGLYLYQLMENPEIGVTNAQDRINQFYNARLMGDKITVVSMLTIRDELGEHKLVLDKSAILKDDKLVQVMEYEDILAYHFLIDEVKIASIAFPNPVTNNGKVVVDVLKSKTKTDLEFDGQRIRLIKRIKSRTKLGGVQMPMAFDLNTARALEKGTNEVIKANCEALFYKYKDDDVDIFDVKEIMMRKYPQYNIENPLKITEIVVEVDTNLEGSDNITDFIR